MREKKSSELGEAVEVWATDLILPAAPSGERVCECVRSDDIFSPLLSARVEGRRRAQIDR